MDGFNKIFSSPLTLPDWTSWATRTPGWPGSTAPAAAPGRCWRRADDGGRSRSAGRRDPGRGPPHRCTGYTRTRWSWWPAPAAPTRSRWPRRPRSSRRGWAARRAGHRRPRLCRTAPTAAPRPSPPGASRSTCARRSWCRVDGRRPPGGPEAAAREARYDALLETAARPRTPTPCCSGTPATTRPRRCCSRWPGAPGRAAWPAMPDRARRRRGAAAAAAARHVAATRPARRAPRSGSSRGRTRTTSTRRTPGRRVRATALPALVDALGPGVVSNLARTARLAGARTPRRSTCWPPRSSRRPGSTKGCRSRCSRHCCRRCAPGCCTPGRCRWAARRPRCRTGTSTALDALVTAWHGQGAGAPARRLIRRAPPRAWPAGDPRARRPA